MENIFICLHFFCIFTLKIENFAPFSFSRLSNLTSWQDRTNIQLQREDCFSLAQSSQPDRLVDMTPSDKATSYYRMSAYPTHAYCYHYISLWASGIICGKAEAVVWWICSKGGSEGNQTVLRGAAPKGSLITWGTSPGTRFTTLPQMIFHMLCYFGLILVSWEREIILFFSLSLSDF